MKHLSLVGFLFLLMMGVNLARAEALESLLRPTLMVGSGVMFEHANDNVSEATRLPLSFGVGARFDRWAARIEYGTFHTTDGNATISTSRDFETMLAWTSYDFGLDSGWTPYVGVALGMARTSTETRLAQTFESAKGTWAGLFAFAAGFRGEWMPHLYVRPELRYESAESFKTKDARMGAFVQLDFIY